MNQNATSFSLIISVIRLLTETDVFFPLLILCSTHRESVHNIFSAFFNLIALATKCRFLLPISTDINSSFGMVSSFFGAFLTLEKTILTVILSFLLCVGRWQLHMLCLTNRKNTVAQWIHFHVNLGRCIEESPFKSVMISFHVVTSPLLSLPPHSFSFSHNFCRNIYILRVTSGIMSRRLKIKVKVIRAFRLVFACSMFSNYFVDMENSSVFVFQISSSNLVHLSFI